VEERTIAESRVVQKLISLWLSGALSPVIPPEELTIYHDGWCASWDGDRCNCSPDIRRKVPRPESRS
jgi:hypothetical protein